MRAGSMEALIGANSNMKMAATPMRVFKEAERRGDNDTMERAIGYVGDFSDKAKEYSKEAGKELQQELREERKEQEVRLEKQAEKIKEREKTLEHKLEMQQKRGVAVEISEEGRNRLEKHSEVPQAAVMFETMGTKDGNLDAIGNESGGLE